VVQRASQADVVVVGGGVIGLATAWVLADEGRQVVLLDRGEPGRAASWAGAGILAPGAKRMPAEPMAALRSLSARVYPEWAERLKAETGLDTGYRRCGGLEIAWDEAGARALEAKAQLWEQEGVAHGRLVDREIQAVEPAVSPHILMAYHLPGRAQVRNPRLLKALQMACQARGVDLRPSQAVLGLEVAGERAVGVRTVGGPIAADSVVLAAGAWSGSLLPDSGMCPTPPVKGQMVLLRAGRPLLRGIVEDGLRYLVPRDDGRVLAGATEEDAGFDTRTTPGAVRDLIDLALRICPALGEAEFERAWAGLRPGSLDHLPYVGPVPGVEGLFLAAGHRRIGLQTAPGTALVMADLIAGRTPRVPIDALRPGRSPAQPGPSAFRS
jgi:glycine oxidase